MPNTVELHGVTKAFGRTIAVDSLDLAVPEGSIYGFIGPNGSGKTTTLRLMLRIYQPDAGRGVVLGSDRGGVADDRLGYLPEERGLYKRMKARAVIEYFARLKGFYDCRPAIDQWLVRLDATSFADQRIAALSKGMAQKIQFITAVIARPRLVILDEPFSGLDPVNLDLLTAAVRHLRDQGATVIFSTHDMTIAERMCDTILMIFRGRKVLDGTLSAIQRRFPVGRIRLRLAEGETPPASLLGVASCTAVDRFYECSLAEGAAPQEVLAQLAAVRTIEHFEVVRPTLHDIFVDIARPPLAEAGAA
ncbi:MAG: ATP-binding cassette domain-containing protein [Pirellulales bacterium]|nr:ATP-binding cassette domain-containing protein [Pirellulales bacterium]